jgi:hypothetical protein
VYVCVCVCVMLSKHTRDDNVMTMSKMRQWQGKSKYFPFSIHKQIKTVEGYFSLFFVSRRGVEKFIYWGLSHFVAKGGICGYFSVYFPHAKMPSWSGESLQRDMKVVGKRYVNYLIESGRISLDDVCEWSKGSILNYVIKLLYFNKKDLNFKLFRKKNLRKKIYLKNQKVKQDIKSFIYEF